VSTPAELWRTLETVGAVAIPLLVLGFALAVRRRPAGPAPALAEVATTEGSRPGDGLAPAGVRRLLAPAGRGPQPGLGALPALLDHVRAAGTSVHLYIDGLPPALPATVDLLVYRIVREALTKAGSHAVVRLVVTAGWVEVEITDDGIGAVAPPPSGGNGGPDVAERVAGIGGELAIGPGAGGRGRRVWALLPIRPV
jgi:hypothetical protein